jgi:hypothetical protein
VVFPKSRSRISPNSWLGDAILRNHSTAIFVDFFSLNDFQAKNVFWSCSPQSAFGIEKEMGDEVEVSLGVCRN